METRRTTSSVCRLHGQVISGYHDDPSTAFMNVRLSGCGGIVVQRAVVFERKRHFAKRVRMGPRTARKST
jgi:hypothetical protein